MPSTLIERGFGSLAGRFLKVRRLRAVLTGLGVSFGVALIVALTILGATLQASVAEQLRQGFGTYDIMAGYRDGRMMTEAEQAELGRIDGVRYSVGILYLTPDVEDRTKAVNYIGIGEFPEGEYGYPVREGRRPGPAEFAVEPRIAEKLRMQIGDTLTLPFATGPQTVRLVGLLPPSGKESSDSLMFNLTWLQQQMNLGSQVTLRVFGLQPGADKANVGANMKARQPDLHLELRTELDEVKKNMGGLKPVAVAFGIAGLFAAVFLVAGAFTVAVQERSRELALLRAVGAGQRQVMGLVLREALLLGALGGLAGVGAGTLIAWGALGASAASLGVAQHAPVFPWTTLALEWLAGVLLALVAAWKPARAAGRVAPLQAMRPDARQEARQEKAGGVLGLVVMGLGAALMAGALAMADGLRALLGAVGGLALAVGLIMALPRILPALVTLLARLLAPIWPAESILAARTIQRHRRRNALTAAILILGIMLTTSVGTIFSVLIRNDQTYVRSQFAGDAQVETQLPGQSVDEALIARIAAVPGVTAVRARGQEVTGEVGAQRRLALVPIDPKTYGTGYPAGGVIITEDLATQWGVEAGDTLPFLPDRFTPAVAIRGLPREELPLKVAVVVANLPFRRYDVPVDASLLPPGPTTAIYFNYDPGQRDQVLRAVRGLLDGTVYLRDLGQELAESRQMGNQRWAIFGAVLAAIFLIATFSLVNAVLTGLNQRKRELATLRALGSTPAQTRRQVVLEAVLLGLTGSLLGVAAGMAFAGGVAVGLEMPLRDALSVGPLTVTCLLAGPVLAALASLPPARDVARGPVYRVLQAE
ncbi:MAG: ftsX-like permease family protein [Symbiobacteriaceae bacterium]|jgi:putative ABC transport system permease protein|nr:ftsX-like permease family protein [Symbiobacteriaceae bacterium]